MWGGTGANVVGLASLLTASDAVVCTAGAHINVDEGGAPERLTGAKLIDVPPVDGKLTCEALAAQLWAIGDVHHVQPAVVSITQSSELGTLYTPDEIGALCELAHSRGLTVHLDGARIANAAAALGGDVRSFTTDAGVDVVSFGGTKNGMMYGEAVLWLDPSLARRAPFLRKQLTQLPSKSRFIAAQFEALLHDGLWLELAGHANAMAARLHAAVVDVSGVSAGAPPAVNGVFPILPRAAIRELQAWTRFYDWDASLNQVRWLCSHDTTETDVDRFAAGVAAVLAEI